MNSRLYEIISHLCFLIMIQNTFQFMLSSHNVHPSNKYFGIVPDRLKDKCLNSKL